MKRFLLLIPIMFISVLATSCYEYIDDMDTLSALNDGLVVYWPVMNDSGSTENDYIGSKNLNLGVGIIKVSGKFSQALSFPNATASTNIFSFPSSHSISIAAWVNIQGNQGFSISIADGTDNVYLRSSDNSAQTVFTVGGFNSSIPYNGIYYNNWNYFSGTFDGTVLKLYVNGNLVASYQYVQSSILTGSTQVIVNGYSIIDEIRIYNRALSEKEITALMDIGME
jgi:hypothetical protein